MTISKTTMTITSPTSAPATCRSRDLIGKLASIYFRNVTHTSDSKFTMWRSSSTHIGNRIAMAPCMHGATGFTYRPRFKVKMPTTAGSTGFTGALSSRSTSVEAMMEFANQPLVVRVSSQYVKTGAVCNVNIYMEN